MFQFEKLAVNLSPGVAVGGVVGQEILESYNMYLFSS